jgi:hypothetical protein
MECSKYNFERYCQTGRRLTKKDKKIKQLAKSCKVRYGGPFPFPPFSAFKKNQATCARILSSKPENVDYVSAGQQLDRFLTEVVDLDNPVRMTNYRGYPEAAIYGLLYLLERNQNECLILSNFDTLVKKIQTSPGISLGDLTDLDWTNVGIVWSWKTNKYKMQVPTLDEDHYVKAAKKCINNKNSRFILNVITIVSRSGYHHANFLLYDKITHIVERFEPYQAFPKNLQMEKFDLELERLFLKIDPNLDEFVGPPNLSFFLKIGLQRQQELEGEQKKFLDPIGFCQPWTFLYADTRLSFPDQRPESIPDYFKTWVKEKNITLTHFIRNYSEHLYQTSRAIFRNFVQESNDIDDPEVALLALGLKQLSIYQTVMT